MSDYAHSIANKLVPYYLHTGLRGGVLQRVITGIPLVAAATDKDLGLLGALEHATRSLVMPKE